ncbi:hypothetical protein ODV19_00365 [Lactobacillus amylovorus]|uniref:Uncharacterized protein n=1 Tax=Lactobacillus amylovorus TaxID=1604 RepID=A0AAW6BB03_LACAM|nr:hypothetical protein [Lactobacillus amylovorus]MDA6088497.1 hypothetical protein [Lactobacillus amylovorus]MDB6247150.1 hypothetical protein [Lactobacillus amylovorus]
MTVSDYIQLMFLLSWIVCLIGLGVLAHIHFKSQKAEKYRLAALNAMRKWVAYYDKQDLDNPAKANGALNDAVVELNHKGYNITDQQVKDLEALRELVLSNLRLKQAQAGLNDDKDNHTEVAQNVPEGDILKPTESVNGGVVKNDQTVIVGESNGN